MHLHTPHLGTKREKRKASVEHTESPVTKRSTRPKKDPKSKKPPKPPTVKAEKKLPAEPQQQKQPLSRCNSPNQTMSSPTQRSSTAEFARQPSTEGPRRSSRIKHSMQGVSDTWHKCRPYIERINGTIMPLEHQGTKAYYARDGVKL